LPVDKLIIAHPEFYSIYQSQTNIAAAYSEVAFLEAHGRRAIAATAALVKDQWSETCPQIIDQMNGGSSGSNTCYMHNKL
jgi:hypothetical protein